ILVDSFGRPGGGAAWISRAWSVVVRGCLCRRRWPAPPGAAGAGLALPFEDATPVRPFPSVKGQHHFPGYRWSASPGRHVGFESVLERDHAMMLDFDPAVVAFSCQPFTLWWRDGPRERHHTPDFFARLADGAGVVVAVRPA